MPPTARATSIQIAAHSRPSARNSRTVSPGPRGPERRAGAERCEVGRPEAGRRAADDDLDALDREVVERDELVRGRAGAFVAIRRR
ncbi:MAG TPA: hypothetical protein VHA79_03875 [Mycobacteriales bacterium]|nr:hypothetical protein [Mycobacteriales bacterium]